MPKHHWPQGWEGRQRNDPQVRRPAIGDYNRNSGGVPGQGLIALRDFPDPYPRSLRGGRTVIWKTKTHQFSATICQRTGRTCPALAQVARALATSTTEAATATSSDFEIEGSSELGFCPAGCTARFRASRDEIRVFCGADPDVETEKLDNYADLLFGTSVHSVSADTLANPPLAMLEALALKHGSQATTEWRPTA